MMPMILTPPMIHHQGTKPETKAILQPEMVRVGNNLILDIEVQQAFMIQDIEHLLNKVILMSSLDTGLPVTRILDTGLQT